MTPFLEELIAARCNGRSCALATVAAAKGSHPRAPGAKMIIYNDGSISGTIGGGKFESLVIEEALLCLEERRVALKTWTLREGESDSFGAICGGEVSVLIEPIHVASHSLFIVGAGHCGQAISSLAALCNFHVSVADDRPDVLSLCSSAHERISTLAHEFIPARTWSHNDAIVIVSRNCDIDHDALAAALRQGGMGYLGMIGSRRKVTKIFDRLKSAGFTMDQLAQVHAPIGLDIGADAPLEIAVSIIAEILMVLRKRRGTSMKSLS